MGAVMIDLLDRISELRELQHLYNEGELRNYDFQKMIQQLERQVDQFEAQYETHQRIEGLGRVTVPMVE